MADDSIKRHVDPRTVLSPKGAITNLQVIYDGGLLVEGDPWSGWSLARLHWYGWPATATRWNGVEGEHPGTPNGRGRSQWHILPSPLGEANVKAVTEHLNGKEEQPNRLRRCVNEFMAAARDATPEEMTRLQLYL